MSAFFSKIIAFIMSVIYFVFPFLAPAVPSVPEGGYTVEGDHLYVSVQTNASTGYQWILLSSDENVIVLEDKQIVTNNNSGGLVGAPETQIITFKAVAEGEFNIVLSYERSFEKDSSVKTVTVTGSVDQDLNITVTDFIAS